MLSIVLVVFFSAFTLLEMRRLPLLGIKHLTD